MKGTTAAILLAVATAIAAAPAATANHGLTAAIAGALEDGSGVVGTATYVGGNYNTQTWSFELTTTNGGAVSCIGFGSWEVGFTAVSCPTDFTVGNTDAHSYPNYVPDAHAITISVGGVSGDAVVVIEDVI